jgi:putative ABC transport system permease protein
MLRNFFTVAARNFLRQKFYSFLNVLGLASGLACTLFIYLWVADELNKDRFHKDIDRIFHVVSNLQMGDGDLITWTITPGPLGEDIRENIPEAETVVRTMPAGAQLFQYGDKSFLERGYYADPDFFNLFSFKILKGKPNKDPQDIKSISISETLAKKLFGAEDPIAKTVVLNDQTDYTVASVFEDVGPQSSIRFEYILPFEIFRKNRGDNFNWGNYDHPLYVKLKDRDQVQAVTDKINKRAATLSQSQGGTANFYMQPFSEYYLNGLYENGKPVGGRIKLVRIFIVVAIFILVIACINFMNMATAKAANRSKEVGIRKVVGAQRKSLIIQFIAESTLISFVSMVFAIGIVFTLLPLFNALVSKQIAIDFGEPVFLASVFTIVIVTGVLAGSYPAFFLSAFQPAHVLKTGGTGHFSRATLRKSLVVIQFVLTVILIASSLGIYRQIEFIRNKNIGYNRESIVTFGLRGNLWKEFDNFKNELQQFPSVVNVSRADQSLVQVNNQNSSVSWPGKPDNSQQFFRTVVVDYDFLETMGLRLIAGRTFSKTFHDTSAFVVTQRAVEVMGLRDPLGQEITQWGIPGKIIGVVEDFHSRSLHEAIDPVVFMCRNQWAGWAFIRIDGAQTQHALQQIERAYKKYNPEYPFAYTFIDEDFEKLYNNEKVTGSLALGFTIIAIIISGLGLLGLAAYSSEKRKKEISIRKAMGATVSSIVSLMSKEFIQLSFLSAVIGCPLAYLLMKKLLEGYAYHTDLRWDLFVLTAVCITLVSIFTVIFQVIKAATANPVDSLRNE